jgi:hypothetical protein
VRAIQVLTIVAIIFTIWIIPSWFVAMHAESKGYSFAGFMLFGLFVNWIFALIVALILNDRRKYQKTTSSLSEIDELERLGELHERGILNKDEFEARKTLLLAIEQD